MKEWFKVFRANTYHPVHKIGPQAIKRTVELYDPKLLLTPLTLGHEPPPDSPALAWFRELRLDETVEFIEARLDTKDITQFGFAVIKSGNRKSLSAAFYAPDDPSNPVRGKDAYYLRHIAYLGADNPAAKGIDLIEFAEDEELEPSLEAEPVLAFEEGDTNFIRFDVTEPKPKPKKRNSAKTTNPQPQGGKMNLDQLIAFFTDRGRGRLDSADLVTFAEQAASTTFNTSGFAERDETSALAFLEGCVAGEVARFKADKANAARFAEQHRTRVTERVSALIQARKFPPKRKDALVETLAALPPTVTATFSEDGKEQEGPIAFAVLEHMEAVTPFVSEDEIAKPEEDDLKFSEHRKAGEKIAAAVNPAKE